VTIEATILYFGNPVTLISAIDAVRWAPPYYEFLPVF